MIIGMWCQFCQTDRPCFDFCAENSSVDYVLFQAATTIKEAIVREWTLLNAADIESLRSFLLRFITKNIRCVT